VQITGAGAHTSVGQFQLFVKLCLSERDWSSGDPLDLTHEDDEVQWVGRRRVEFSEVEVEVAGALRFRVDDKRTSADGMRRLICTEHRILHEGGPNTVALRGEVDTKAREQDDWDWAPAGRLQECPWGVSVGH
jgi:hypothetical protein